MTSHMANNKLFAIVYIYSNNSMPLSVNHCKLLHCKNNITLMQHLTNFNVGRWEWFKIEGRQWRGLVLCVQGLVWVQANVQPHFITKS